MYFIYQLLHKEKVFYIGLTTNVIVRYKTHCACGFSTTRHFINEILIKDELPDCKIMHHFNDKEVAINKEKELIMDYSTNGYDLINLGGNKNYDKDIAKTLKKQLANRIKPKGGYANNIVEYVNNYIEINNLGIPKYKKFALERPFKSNAYSQSLFVYNTLELNGEIFIEVDKVSRFRKYLFDHARNTGKEYVMKQIDGKTRVNRFK